MIHAQGAAHDRHLRTVVLDCLRRRAARNSYTVSAGLSCWGGGEAGGLGVSLSCQSEPHGPRRPGPARAIRGSPRAVCNDAARASRDSCKPLPPAAV